MAATQNKCISCKRNSRMVLCDLCAKLAKKNEKRRKKK